MAEENLHSKHRERMREKLQKQGMEALLDHEVLEMLLYRTIARGDTNELAHRLLKRFGSLHGVIEAPEEELLRVAGVGRQTAYHITFERRFINRYLTDIANNQLADEPINTLERISAYFVPQLLGLQEERMLAAFLDNKGRVLCCEIVGMGSATQLSVDTRLVAEIALRSNAAGVVFAHNHPNGDITPSQQDITTTRVLENMLSSIQVQFVEHLVVAGERYTAINALRAGKGRF